MEFTNVRESLTAIRVQIVADVLTALFSGNWGTGNSSDNSFSPAGSWTQLFCQDESDMKSEERRLKTFERWPDSAPASPGVLAAAGFYYIGPEYRVKCFRCGGVLHHWFAEDDLLAEHAALFPSCPFVQGRNAGRHLTPPAEDTQDSVDGQFLGMLQTLSVEEASADSQPEYPDMETEGDRLATFQNWPSYARVSPEILAGAGFFYTGQGDYVRCFYCDGALRNWERGDDPWMEHARWFPSCKFLLQSRGRGFVNSIQESYLATPVSREDSLHQLEQQSGSNQEPAEREPDTGRQRREARTECSNEPESVPTIEERLRQLQEERTCKVCMDKEVSILLVPCGHLVVCSDCAPNLRRCPICRGAIRDSMKAFMS
ncbi:baculoviral IAP repeat-containing protein 7 isoform X1 [Pogona vitticeps]